MKTQTTVFTENGYLNEGQALELIQYLTKFCKEHKPGELVQIYHQHSPNYKVHPLTKLALCRVEYAQPERPLRQEQANRVLDKAQEEIARFHMEGRLSAQEPPKPVHTPWQDQEP